MSGIVGRVSEPSSKGQAHAIWSLDPYIVRTIADDVDEELIFFGALSTEYNNVLTTFVVMTVSLTGTVDQAGNITCRIILIGPGVLLCGGQDFIDAFPGMVGIKPNSFDLR